MGLSSQEYSVFGLFKVYKSLQITSGFTRFYYKSLEAQGFHRDELKLDPSGTSLQIGIRVSDI